MYHIRNSSPTFRILRRIARGCINAAGRTLPRAHAYRIGLTFARHKTICNW